MRVYAGTEETATASIFGFWASSNCERLSKQRFFSYCVFACQAEQCFVRAMDLPPILLAPVRVLLLLLPPPPLLLLR